MILYKEYIKTDVEGKEIKFVITFNKEPYSWVTSQSKKIGYQVTVVPVSISRKGNIIMEEYGAFTGFNDCLLEVTRQSSKRLVEAISALKSRQPVYMKNLKLKYDIKKP